MGTPRGPKRPVPNARTPYEGTALLGDPLHGYIPFTVPYPWNPRERTEKDLLDSPWMQRLRYIYQLQSARWVYPSAEHSRFVHSLGAMWVAGKFARHLYPSLKAAVPETPSEACVEELLRLAALLHDIGHGPFGHFFDDNYLEQYGLTHERVGQEIILKALGGIIRQIRRSPHAPFASGEGIDPRWITFLINKTDAEQVPAGMPRWVRFLQPLLGGVYTADNLDYVLRDAYMCGVAIGPVDLDRLIHYTFFTPEGLTLHKAGGSALTMFLQARLYLYTNVYYHRTTRAIDLHLREIFPETMRLLFPRHPLRALGAYQGLTDWSLLEEVRGWARSPVKRRRALGREWARVLGRSVKWKMAYETTLSMKEFEKGRTLITPEVLEVRIRAALPARLRRFPFRVDLAAQDPRPVNPLVMGYRQIHVFNPSTKQVSKEPLREYFDYLPAKVVQCRIFAPSHAHDRILSEAAERVLVAGEESIKTHV